MITTVKLHDTVIAKTWIDGRKYATAVHIIGSLEEAERRAREELARDLKAAGKA